MKNSLNNSVLLFHNSLKLHYIRLDERNLEMINPHVENDKRNVPFLLAASFLGYIKFVGHYSVKGITFWQFEPKGKAQLLLDQLQTKTEPRIPAKDLFEATETFWKQVKLAKESNIAG
jgi:hypothetical protein